MIFLFDISCDYIFQTTNDYCCWPAEINVSNVKQLFTIPTQMKSVRKMREVMMQSAPRPMAALEFLVYSISVVLVLVET